MNRARARASLRLTTADCVLKQKAPWRAGFLQFTIDSTQGTLWLLRANSGCRCTGTRAVHAHYPTRHIAGQSYKVASRSLAGSAASVPT